MTIFRRDPAVLQRTVPEGKVDWLGQPIGGYQYATHGGREYAVDLHPADPEAFSPGRGEILVSRRRREVFDGTPLETIAYYRAWPVAAGTYAKLAVKAPKPVADKPMRAWDRLAVLPVMQRREPVRMPAEPVSAALDHLEVAPVISDQESEILAGALQLATRNRSPKVIEFGGNEPPERSVSGLVAFLAGRGIELSLVRGRLLARSRTPIRSDLRTLIEQARELLVGQLRGQPVICSECAEPAVSIAFPDAPMCATHLEPRQ